jgi:hypothetical protein
MKQETEERVARWLMLAVLVAMLAAVAKVVAENASATGAHP